MIPIRYRPRQRELRLGDALAHIGEPEVVVVLKTEGGFAVYRAEDRRAAGRGPQTVRRGHHHVAGAAIPPAVRFSEAAAVALGIEPDRDYAYEVIDGAILVTTRPRAAPPPPLCPVCDQSLPPGRIVYCSETCKRSAQNRRNYERRKLR